LMLDLTTSSPPGNSSGPCLSLAILSAAVIERKERMALALVVLLGVFCMRHSAMYFLTSREDWQSAADAILEQLQRGARLVVLPPDQMLLYTFFHPELAEGRGASNRIVMAVTPLAARGQGQRAVAAYLRAGYGLEHECVIGGSRI